MVARLLSLCGLYLGPADQLLEPDKGNPLGHFEHKGFLKIDEALLAYFGGATDHPPDFKPGWERDSSLQVFFDEARLILETFSGRSLWGWKEPRTTILLPFWKSLIPSLRFVICLRSPLEVARSLVKRNGLSVEKGFYLWNHYTRAAIRDTEGCPRILTFYEDYFRDASAEIRRLVEFCGLSQLDEASRIDDAIFQDLRHHTSETLELLDETNVATEYKLIYIGLRALSSREFVGTASGDGRRDRPSESLGRFLRLMDEFRSQEKMAQLQTTLAEKDQQLGTFRTTMRKREEQITQLQQQMAQLREHADRLQAFSDAVRRTLAYRFYSKLIKPFISK